MVLKAKIRIGAVIAALLIAAVAAADEADPMAACDNGFATCNSRCDALENATAECYGACDDAYQKCLDAANGYPAAEEKSAASKPASAAAKKPKKSLPASKSQNEGAAPDSGGHQQ